MPVLFKQCKKNLSAKFLGLATAANLAACGTDRSNQENYVALGHNPLEAASDTPEAVRSCWTEAARTGLYHAVVGLNADEIDRWHKTKGGGVKIKSLQGRVLGKDGRGGQAVAYQMQFEYRSDGRKKAVDIVLDSFCDKQQVSSTPAREYTTKTWNKRGECSLEAVRVALATVTGVHGLKVLESWNDIEGGRLRIKNLSESVRMIGDVAWFKAKIIHEKRSVEDVREVHMTFKPETCEPKAVVPVTDDDGNWN